MSRSQLSQLAEVYALTCRKVPKAGSQFLSHSLPPSQLSSQCSMLICGCGNARSHLPRPMETVPFRSKFSTNSLTLWLPSSGQARTRQGGWTSVQPKTGQAWPSWCTILSMGVRQRSQRSSYSLYSKQCPDRFLARAVTQLLRQPQWMNLTEPAQWQRLRRGLRLLLLRPKQTLHSFSARLQRESILGRLGSYLLRLSLLDGPSFTLSPASRSDSVRRYSSPPSMSAQSLQILRTNSCTSAILMQSPSDSWTRSSTERARQRAAVETEDTRRVQSSAISWISSRRSGRGLVRTQETADEL